MAKTFLDKIYRDSTQAETNAVYEAWAHSYDDEVRANGYATPGRLVEALSRALPVPEAQILDFGCGTGLSGLALGRAGYKNIDGLDPSTEMLAQARTKGIYRNLSVLDVEDPTPIPKGTYRAIVAIGVVGPGAAPPETLHILMNALETGNLLGFSFNDHALAEPSYEGVLNQWLESGAVTLISKEYGDHLPKQNMKSNVYIVEKQ